MGGAWSRYFKTQKNEKIRVLIEETHSTNSLIDMDGAKEVDEFKELIFERGRYKFWVTEED